MNMLSLPECQVLMQDIALELTRLDKRLGKIHSSHGSQLLANSPLEAELPGRICDLRHKYLQQAVLLLLELAQMAAKTRLQNAAAHQETSNLQARIIHQALSREAVGAWRYKACAFRSDAGIAALC
jgi:hypothetical protein